MFAICSFCHRNGAPAATVRPQWCAAPLREVAHPHRKHWPRTGWARQIVGASTRRAAFRHRSPSVNISPAGFLWGDADMRIVTIAAIIAALTLPAYAQGRGGGAPKAGQKSEAEKAADEKQRKLDEKAYQDSVSRIPDREQKLDPWGKIR